MIVATPYNTVILYALIGGLPLCYLATFSGRVAKRKDTFGDWLIAVWCLAVCASLFGQALDVFLSYPPH